MRRDCGKRIGGYKECWRKGKEIRVSSCFFPLEVYLDITQCKWYKGIWKGGGEKLISYLPMLSSSFIVHEPSPLHLRRLKSQHQGNHRGIPPPPHLLPLDGCCLGERCYIPSSPSRVYPLLHGVLVPVHR